jgi:hypothetical protein
MREILLDVGAVKYKARAEAEFQRNITNVAIRIRQGRQPLTVSTAKSLIAVRSCPLQCGLAHYGLTIGVSAKAEGAAVAGVWIEDQGNYTLS